VAIHPTAVIHPSVELDVEVDVGPYAVVGARVRIGRGSRIHAHAIVEGPTKLGVGTVVHSFAVVGGAPQDKRAAGEPGSLEVGDRNVFREHVTVHRGTSLRATRIGNDNLFMVGCHVAHDVEIGDFVTLANGVLLAGHVVVESHATFAGAAAIAQHLRIGESSFVAGGAMVERDVPPFVVVQGDRARIRGLNKVGLKRREFDEATIVALERAVRALLFGHGTIAARAEKLAASPVPEVAKLGRACLRA
jgi:UDP-N-acetylglucosamine acyltransferase